MIENSQLIGEMLDYGGVSDEKIVGDLIMSHDVSDMQMGMRYYSNEGDIIHRKLYHYEAGVPVEDTARCNRRLANNWHKLLVDQKTSYLTAKPLRFSADDTKVTTLINKYLGEKFDDALCELVKGASNKGVEWLHVYIDEDGNFGFVVIPAQQVIPIWDTNFEKKLEGVIRYYDVTDIFGGRQTMIEWWNKDTVKHFTRDGSGKVKFEREECHFYCGGQGYGWGRVPFIAFKNNEEMIGDLKFYKSLIDDYDLALSDLSNNLAQVQEVVTVLKGYEGTDLREFAENLRRYKVIKVSAGDGSGVDKLEISIPIEAKRELLNRLEENIFLFGQGVNVKTDKLGTNPSGVALKFLYALLDMKAGMTERKFTLAIKELLWFLFEYFAMSGMGRFDISEVAVIFGKRLIANEAEMAQIAKDSKGIISDSTIIAHHPWTEDVDFEIKSLSK